MLRPSPSSTRAAATTPAEPVGARVARFPTAGSLPRISGGSASASLSFEACSAFTRVAARVVAEPPEAALVIGVLQPMSLPPSSAPTATGWSDSCRAGFAPAVEWRLVTAHRKNTLSAVGRPFTCSRRCLRDHDKQLFVVTSGTTPSRHVFCWEILTTTRKLSFYDKIGSRHIFRDHKDVTLWASLAMLAYPPPKAARYSTANLTPLMTLDASACSKTALPVPHPTGRTWPHGWPQSASRHRHLLEHRPAG